MSDTKENIIIGIVCLMSISLYVFGVLTWRQYEFNTHAEIVAKAKHIYFICFSSAFYAASLVGVFLCKTALQRICTRSLNTFCAVIIYQEIVYGDQQWTVWSWMMAPLIVLNYFLLYWLVDLYKNRSDGE